MLNICSFEDSWFVMKILAFSDIYILDSPNEKLQSLVMNEKIDIILLLGGLFNNEKSGSIKENPKKIKKKKNQKQEITLIPELNWLLIPILVVPDEQDLQMSKLIKQIQGQETVWVRFIHNKGTIIDNWFIFGITYSSDDENQEIMKNIQEYSKLAPDHSILIYSGDKKMKFPKMHTIILSNQGKTSETDAFIVNVDSLRDNMVTIIDLDNKAVNSLVLE